MTKKKVSYTLFHTVFWVLVALPPIVFAPQHIPQDAVTYLIRLSLPAFMCVVFYINYFWLVPVYFIGNRLNVFLSVNVLMVILLSMCMQQLTDMLHTRELMAGWIPPPDQNCPLWSGLLVFVLRNVFSLSLCAVVATLLQLAQRWQRAEDARREIEIQKTDAELANLRNQIKPHFLLNTLNNIYALISFDQEKAQKAVLALSSLLRQMLYDGQDNVVTLKAEAEFIRNYIDLMSLRMSKNVTIDVDISIPDRSDVMIAPFIIISLVENAFKHGVCLTKPSFISVKLHSDGASIVCEISNSNHPKSSADKSGHGIGLNQVAKRLELAYSGKYKWTKGVDKANDMYISKLIIYDTKLCNNR